ncbi:hypothetical protein M514_04881 [Trichuris suis]|uniref:Uncharacterized protein n=1 Tax=Trichuris suis TaxID=68888 RepID=A0A085MAU3_9BILA|nr:hypothetical protein M513_04881 [Trichuris suis]KFD73103.1 hypothetical protein M514_04881 [Trichuris suis]
MIPDSRTTGTGSPWKSLMKMTDRRHLLLTIHLCWKAEDSFAPIAVTSKEPGKATTLETYKPR